jgi:hypothetical protein
VVLTVFSQSVLEQPAQTGPRSQAAIPATAVQAKEFKFKDDVEGVVFVVA